MPATSSRTGNRPRGRSSTGRWSTKCTAQPSATAPPSARRSSPTMSAAPGRPRSARRPARRSADRASGHRARTTGRWCPSTAPARGRAAPAADPSRCWRRPPPAARARAACAAPRRRPGRAARRRASCAARRERRGARRNRAPPGATVRCTPRGARRRCGHGGPRAPRGGPEPAPGGPARLGAHPCQTRGRCPEAAARQQFRTRAQLREPAAQPLLGGSIRIRVPEKSKSTPVIVIRRILSATGHGRQEATVLA